MWDRPATPCVVAMTAPAEPGHRMGETPLAVPQSRTACLHPWTSDDLLPFVTTIKYCVKHVLSLLLKHGSGSMAECGGDEEDVTDVLIKMRERLKYNA